MQTVQRRTHVLIVTVFTALATLVSTIPAATAAPPTDSGRVAPAVPPVAWTPCNDGFQCAQYTVPLDYDHPKGRQISLALAKLPATDPGRRIGSLFVNPGGPGGSGVDFVLGAGPDLFTPEVRARFDIVGFDPRGILGSTPLRCFATQQEADDAWILSVPVSQLASQAPQLDRGRSGGGRSLRAPARGPSSITCRPPTWRATSIDCGRRWGTSCSPTTEFPTAVSSGTCTPTCSPGASGRWSSTVCSTRSRGRTGRGTEGRRVPFATRLRSAVGAQDTLKEFFRLCDAGGSNCAFGAERGSTVRQSLPNPASENPLLLPEEDGTTHRVRRVVPGGRLVGTDVRVRGLARTSQRSWRNWRRPRIRPESRPHCRNSGNGWRRSNTRITSKAFLGWRAPTASIRGRTAPGTGPLGNHGGATASSVRSGPGSRASAPNGRATPRTATSGRSPIAPRSRCWWSGTGSIPPLRTTAPWWRIGCCPTRDC